MRTFYDGDGYPDLGLYFRFFDVAVSGTRSCEEGLFC